MKSPPPQGMRPQMGGDTLPPSNPPRSLSNFSGSAANRTSSVHSLILLLAGCASTPAPVAEPTDEPAPPPPLADTEGPGWRIRDQVFESAISGVRVRPSNGWRYAVELIRGRPGTELAMVDQDGAVALGLSSERAPGLSDADAMAEIDEQLGESVTRLEEALSVDFLGAPLRMKRFEAHGSHLAIGMRCASDTCVSLSLTSTSPEGLRNAAQALPEFVRMDEPAREALERELHQNAPLPDRVYGYGALRGGTLIVYPLGFQLVFPRGIWEVESLPGSPAMFEANERSSGTHVAVGVAPLEDETHLEAHESFIAQMALDEPVLEEIERDGHTLQVSIGAAHQRAGSAVVEVDEGRFLVWWFARARTDIADPIVSAFESSIHFGEPIAAVALQDGRFTDRRMGVAFMVPPEVRLQDVPEPPPLTGLYLFVGPVGRTQVAVSRGEPALITASLAELAERDGQVGRDENGAFVAFPASEGSAPGIAFGKDGRLFQIQGEDPATVARIRATLETLERP